MQYKLRLGIRDRLIADDEPIDLQECDYVEANQWFPNKGKIPGVEIEWMDDACGPLAAINGYKDNQLASIFCVVRPGQWVICTGSDIHIQDNNDFIDMWELA